MTETSMEQNNSGRTGGRLWIILLIVLLLLVAGGLGGGYFLQQNELTQLEAGRAAIAAGEWETAVAELEPVINPTVPFLAQHTIEATGLRGVAQYHLGDSEAALVDLTVALEQDPNLVDLYGYRALLHFEGGETDFGLADSEQALAEAALIPDHLQARLQAYQAAALFEAGEMAEAAEAAVEAEAAAHYLSDEQLGDVYVVLAQTAEADDEVVAYGRELAELGTDIAEAVTAQLLLAEIGVAQAAGDDAAVLMLSEELLALDDQLSDEQIAAGYVQRAEIFLARGEEAMALEMAQNAAEYDASLALSLALEAWQLYQQFEFDEALNKANEALELEENSVAYRVRGAIQVAQSRFAEGVADLEQAVELDGQDAEGWLLLARAYRVQSQFDAFVEAAEAAVEIAPASVAGLWAQGLLHVHDYEIEQGRAVFDAAVALDDGRPKLFLDRAETFYLTDDRELKLADIEQSVALNPNDPEALAAEAYYYLEQYEDERLDDTIAILLEIAPESMERYMLERSRAWINNDLEAALEAVESALAINEMATYLQRSKISIQYDLDGDAAVAEAALQEVLAQNPDSVSTRVDLAQLMALEQRWEEAYQFLDEAKERASFFAWLYVEYTFVAYEEGDIDKLWSYAQQALILDPDLPEGYTARGLAHSAAGDFVEATSDYSRALDVYPNYGQARLLLAANYLDLGDFDAARRELNRVIEIMPQNPFPHYLLSLLALFDEDVDEAKAQIELFADKGNDSVEQFVNHSGILVDLGFYEEALEIAQDGLRISDVGDLYYFQGLSQLFLGEKEAAQDSLREALTYPAPVDRVVQIEDDLIASQSAAEVVGDLFVVTDEALGYTIGYPIDWVPQDAESLDAAFFVGIDSDEKFGAVYLAVIEDIPGVSSRALADLVGQQLGNQLGYTQLSLTTTTFAGRNGVWVRAYELNLGNGFVLTGQQYYLAVSPGTAYILTVETTPEAQETTAEDLQRIIDSFAIVS